MKLDCQISFRQNIDMRLQYKHDYNWVENMSVYARSYIPFEIISLRDTLLHCHRTFVWGEE